MDAFLNAPPATTAEIAVPRAPAKARHP